LSRNYQRIYSDFQRSRMTSWLVRLLEFHAQTCANNPFQIHIISKLALLHEAWVYLEFD